MIRIKMFLNSVRIQNKDPENIKPMWRNKV